MRTSNAFLGAAVLIATLLLVVYGIATFGQGKVNSAATNAAAPSTVTTPIASPTVQFGNPALGPKGAKVTIVEFGDFQCEPCAQLAATLKDALAQYPNDVRLVWKDFPNTGLHAEALNAAMAARCADAQGAFWEYHDVLLDKQSDIGPNNYVPFAAQLHLDLDAFQTCMDSKTPAGLIDRDNVEAQRLQIDATPYLFINGRRVSGAIDAEQLKGFIDSALNAAKSPDAATPPVNQ